MNADFRVILKESLRSVPIYGWAMQIMMYIFVSRKREEDIPYLRKILSYLICTGHSPSLLLFPEGTDLNESNKKKSNACKFFRFFLNSNKIQIDTILVHCSPDLFSFFFFFFSDALAKNLPILEYVLYPKLSGLLCILNMLKERRENQIQLLSSEKHGSTETTFTRDSDDVLNTNAVQVNQVDRNNVLLEKNKEHKADCVRNIPEVTPSVTFHESKDGYQKEEKEKERDVAKDIKVIRKKDVNDVICNNSSSQLKITERSTPKSHRATTALHDLTIAYKDYLPGKKTTHRSILYGKFYCNKPYLFPSIHLVILDDLFLYFQYNEIYECKERIFLIFDNDQSSTLRLVVTTRNSYLRFNDLR
jgi:Acyltransferase